LNGLDNKLSFDWDFHSVLETDRTAWQETIDLAFCPKNNQFPVTDTRWGLVGNAGCYSMSHTDSNGYATVIEVLAGYKEWFVAIPRPERGIDAFASINTFTNGFNIETANEDRFMWEKVCLDPTTIL